MIALGVDSGLSCPLLNQLIMVLAAAYNKLHMGVLFYTLLWACVLMTFE